MTANPESFIAGLICLIALWHIARLGWSAAADNHARGMAAIHGDRDTPSWSPRIPSQRGRG